MQGIVPKGPGSNWSLQRIRFGGSRKKEEMLECILKKKRSVSPSHKSRTCVSVSCKKKKKEEEVGVHPRKGRRGGVHPAKKEKMRECIPGKKAGGADVWVDPG